MPDPQTEPIKALAQDLGRKLQGSGRTASAEVMRAALLQLAGEVGG